MFDHGLCNCDYNFWRYIDRLMIMLWLLYNCKYSKHCNKLHIYIYMYSELKQWKYVRSFVAYVVIISILCLPVDNWKMHIRFRDTEKRIATKAITNQTDHVWLYSKRHIGIKPDNQTVNRPVSGRSRAQIMVTHMKWGNIHSHTRLTHTQARARSMSVRGGNWCKGDKNAKI